MCEETPISWTTQRKKNETEKVEGALRVAEDRNTPGKRATLGAGAAKYSSRPERSHQRIMKKSIQ